MAVYVDYSYYTTVYLGTAISATDFPRLAMRASTVIDQLTFNRVAAVVTAATDTALIDKLKMATCAVAEIQQDRDESNGADGLTSERLGNYSVTYGANSAAAKSHLQKCAEAARLCLAQTGLMYPGLTDDAGQ
jgi:hypothetical protein